MKTLQQIKRNARRELSDKLRARFGVQTTIGEDRYASNFLNEDVFPVYEALISEAYQLGKDASVEYIHNHLMTNDWHTTAWKALLDQARSV